MTEVEERIEKRLHASWKRYLAETAEEIARCKVVAAEHGIDITAELKAISDVVGAGEPPRP